jgi:hypothetical protein
VTSEGALGDETAGQVRITGGVTGEPVGFLYVNEADPADFPPNRTNAGPSETLIELSRATLGASVHLAIAFNAQKSKRKRG